jgi:hypothetical protein
MAPVGTEFNERLYADIVGELLDNVDLATVLQTASEMEIERTRDQIDEALNRARQARQIQDDIFSYVAGYDPNALRGTLGFTMQHVGLFIQGMLPAIGASLIASQHDGGVLDIRLPERLRGAFPEFAQRTAVRITTDRRFAQRLKDVVLLDFETSFFRYLIAHAKSQAFDGIYASVASPAGADGVLAAFKLRWQNDQGDALTEEFVPLFAPTEGEIQAEPAFLAQMLVSRLTSAVVPNPERAERESVFSRLVAAAECRLAAESTRFKHPNSLVYLAAADCRPG